MPKTIRTACGRVAVFAAAAALLQGCDSLQQIRVSPLPQESSSANRSMLSQFNPLPFQHRSVDDGMLLRAPENRGRGLFFRRW
jgi:type IV pilus biogenesis protein CpaD/CtpE